MIDRDHWLTMPPTDVILWPNEVHVWRASLDQPESHLQWLAQTLAADERLRVERFYFERDRKRFIAGRGILRTILGCYLGIEPSHLQFCYSPLGKPTLAETSGGSSLRFNLTHSQGLALYAITYEREVGVDLERIRFIAEAEQIIDLYFSAREKVVFHALATHEKREALFTWWTRKEAYLKASGEGLTETLNQIDVSLTPGEPARLLSIGGDVQEAARWSLRELRPASGFAAALAVEGRNWDLACWHWPSE